MRFVVFLLLFELLLVGGCKPEKKYHDKRNNKAQLSSGSTIDSIIAFQDKLNAEFKDPEESPLPDRYRKDFESLDFFLPDTSYVVQARFERTPEAIPFLMPTTTDRTAEEVVYGLAYFTLNGRQHRLEIYQNKELMLEEGYEDYLFLPFTDLTNGEETYGGGRYIDLRIPAVSNQITIDFNRAYNPYCVYNKKYSCPLVPAVNHLETQVTAGVKDFKSK